MSDSPRQYTAFRVIEVIREAHSIYLEVSKDHLEQPGADIVLIYNTGPFDQAGADTDIMWQDRVYRGFTDGYSMVTIDGWAMRDR